ncbi:unnamed protein product [Caenorhabditis bovis]|uniref:Peptidase A1 domain-containing protein n=1 Tax=Caenorhabditis bovis TaxID=2654633 RepID=A0A8S1ENZ7_9PELO|nr:unnamed protein product [Caenorhabditis bovis]
MQCLLGLLLLIPASIQFALPFRVQYATTNITKGGQTLEQVGRGYFVANLTLGTPGQLFTVIIDTKSSDLLIPDISCAQPECSKKHKFDASKSSTYKKFGKEYVVPTVFGNFQGGSGFDTAVIGDRKTDLITVPDVKFLQSKSIGPVLAPLKADGIMGMAFPSLSKISWMSPFYQGWKNGDIQESFFSIWLEHSGQTDDLGTHGVIYYGGLDPVHCLPDAQYVPLIGTSYFYLNVNNVKIQGSYTKDISRNYPAIVDSTATNLELPRNYIADILESIGENIDYVDSFPVPVACNTKLTLTFTFPGYINFDITERDLVVDNGDGTCSLQVAPNDVVIHLGIPFFRGRCVYFDVGRERIGVATAKLQD